MAEGYGQEGANNQPNYPHRLGQNQGNWKNWTGQNYILGSQPPPRPPFVENYQTNLASTRFNPQSVYGECHPPPPYPWPAQEMPSTSRSWPPMMPTQGGFGLQPYPGPTWMQLPIQPMPQTPGQLWATSAQSHPQQMTSPPVYWDLDTSTTFTDEQGVWPTQPCYYPSTEEPVTTGSRSGPVSCFNSDRKARQGKYRLQSDGLTESREETEGVSGGNKEPDWLRTTLLFQYGRHCGQISAPELTRDLRRPFSSAEQEEQN